MDPIVVEILSVEMFFTSCDMEKPDPRPSQFFVYIFFLQEQFQFCKRWHLVYPLGSSIGTFCDFFKFSIRFFICLIFDVVTANESIFRIFKVLVYFGILYQLPVFYLQEVPFGHPRPLKQMIYYISITFQSQAQF